MKQSINIRCMQHFLYFESHTKSLKLLHIIVCFSVLSISSAFTISTYFINECMLPRWNFKKTNILGACTNNGSKIKLSTNRGHITFLWIWGLTGITFAGRKSIAIARKIYLRLFFFTFERITCYLEYIWFTHNMFCILQHDWRCNMQGRIQDFKLAGGALQKIAPSGGRRENCWSISCEES